MENVCVEVGLFSLNCILLKNEEGMSLLERDGLVDYIICLPWCVPGGERLKERASEIVSVVRSARPKLQPPSLLTLTKVKLASYLFGLEKVIATDSVHELIRSVS